jgi:hypothetical protein
MRRAAGRQQQQQQVGRISRTGRGRVVRVGAECHDVLTIDYILSMAAMAMPAPTSGACQKCSAAEQHLVGSKCIDRRRLGRRGRVAEAGGACTVVARGAALGAAALGALVRICQGMHRPLPTHSRGMYTLRIADSVSPVKLSDLVGSSTGRSARTASMLRIGSAILGPCTGLKVWVK